MGKSAQFLLHTWLPDAMEGPTPVSALIHAATMVTAGVFMVARLSPLFELAPNAQAFVTFVGATTAFFAATVGLVQNDIKRDRRLFDLLAARLHVRRDGRRRLFGRHVPPVHPRLLQGAAVPRLRLGDPWRCTTSRTSATWAGCENKIPFTYWCMVIGTLALTGFPLTAGYFSKDAIIEAAYVGPQSVRDLRLRDDGRSPRC